MNKNENCEIVECYDIDSVIVSDNGGITWFHNKRFRKNVTFPYIPPTDPEKVYIEYAEDDTEKYEIITGDKYRIKALYERKRKEYDEVYWD